MVEWLPCFHWLLDRRSNGKFQRNESKQGSIGSTLQMWQINESERNFPINLGNSLSNFEKVFLHKFLRIFLGGYFNPQTASKTPEKNQPNTSPAKDTWKFAVLFSSTGMHFCWMTAHRISVAHPWWKRFQSKPSSPPWPQVISPWLKVELGAHNSTYRGWNPRYPFTRPCIRAIQLHL